MVAEVVGGCNKMGRGGRIVCKPPLGSLIWLKMFFLISAFKIVRDFSSRALFFLFIYKIYLKNGLFSVIFQQNLENYRPTIRDGRVVHCGVYETKICLKSNGTDCKHGPKQSKIHNFSSFSSCCILGEEQYLDYISCKRTICRQIN